jgi:hypothetical protein
MENATHIRRIFETSDTPDFVSDNYYGIAQSWGIECGKFFRILAVSAIIYL